ncbi:MAG: acyl-CoA thioesterase [Paludibacteraceae bacterium]|nr:acyl-CoA thioesterase [Paludibacteraceae bacterium]
MTKKNEDSQPKLTNIIKKKIPFYEIDGIHMMWHGNYVKYLEDGREAFGEEFGLEYMHIFNSGYVAPIVDLHLKYKKTASLGDTLIVETTYVPCDSAKLMFTYTIYREKDNAILLKATSTQLFLTRDGVFELSSPKFLKEWRQNIITKYAEK